MASPLRWLAPVLVIGALAACGGGGSGEMSEATASGKGVATADVGPSEQIASGARIPAQADTSGVGSAARFAPPPGIAAGQDVNISESAAGDVIEGATEVSVEINPLNPKHLVAMANSGSFLYYSLDGGASWRSVSMADAGVFTAPGVFHTDPSITFDDQGNLYATTGSLALGQLAVCRFDNGTFATTPVRPTYCTLVPADDKWHIGAGPGPYVYAAYSRGVDLRLSYSTDGGRTFTESSTIFGSETFQAFPRPVVDSGGSVFVAWYERSNRKFKVRRSDDHGQTFGPERVAAQGRAAFDPTYVCSDNVGVPVPAQPCRGIFAGPVVSVDRSGGPFNGRLYLTYVDQGASGGNDYDIFVVRSEDGGTTWLPATSLRGRPAGSINDDAVAATQFLPWLSVDQKTGTVSAIWYDTRNDPVNVKVRTYIATSVDGGKTFGPNTPVADGESDESNHGTYVTSGFDYAEYIGIAVDACVAHAVWSDNHQTHASAAGWFRSNPRDGDNLTLNGVVWTFVSAMPTGNQTQISSNPDPVLAKSETVRRLVVDLNASADQRIQAARYTVNAFDVMAVEAKAAGATGGEFTIAAANGATACAGDGSCFVNFADQGITRLIITLNLKTDQVPVACTPGDRLLVVSGLSSPAAAGRVLRYEGHSGAFMDEFIPNCLRTAPPTSVDCASAPGAAENPVDMAIGPDRRLYVADTAIGGTSTTPSGVAVKRYVGATGRFDDQNDPYAAFVLYGSGGLQQVGGLAFGPDSNLYVSDFNTGAVLRFHGQSGALLNPNYVAPGTLLSPGKLVFGPDGNLYVLELGGNRVLAFQGPFGVSPGTSMGEFVASGANGGLDSPSAAVFGPDRKLYVASFLSDSVLRYQGPFDPSPGAFIDAVVPHHHGGLSRPAGLAFGPDGNLYVSSNQSRAVLGFDTKTKAVAGTLAYVVKPGTLLFSSVPAANPTLGDFYPVGSPDGCVGRADLGVLRDAIRMGSTDLRYDLTGDGLVDDADGRKLTELFDNVNGKCP